jgi:hypothetical protein
MAAVRFINDFWSTNVNALKQTFGPGLRFLDRWFPVHPLLVMNSQKQAN